MAHPVLSDWWIVPPVHRLAALVSTSTWYYLALGRGLHCGTHGLLCCLSLSIARHACDVHRRKCKRANDAVLGVSQSVRSATRFPGRGCASVARLIRELSGYVRQSDNSL